MDDKERIKVDEIIRKREESRQRRDAKKKAKFDERIRKSIEAQKPENQKKRNTRESFFLGLTFLFLPIFSFWFLGWLTDISELKEHSNFMSVMMFGWVGVWVSGYKYDVARGWAEIEVRMLPMEERIARSSALHSEGGNSSALEKRGTRKSSRWIAVVQHQ